MGTAQMKCKTLWKVSRMSDMRAALVAIQELHPIEETGVEYHGIKEVWCPTCREHAPCPTRKLADEGLGGDGRG